MKIWSLVFAIALAAGSSLAKPVNSRSLVKFLGRDYEITRLTSVEDRRTEARAYIVAPDTAVSSVIFDTEVRRVLDSDSKGRSLPISGYVWQVEAATQRVAIGDGTLLFVERVGETSLISVFAVGNSELRDEELFVVIERYRSQMAHTKQTEPNKALVPTVMSVTPAADAPVAPATTAAHL